MNHKFDNLFLIGPMGSGKSAIGKQIAKLSGLPFYDSDQEIEQHTGVSISWIFAQEGEAGFRKREKEMIDSLTQQHPIVLATGGGCIVTPENSNALSERGVVVYLYTSIDTQVQRITQQKFKRPLFTDKAQLQALNQSRQSRYEAIADLTYCTDQILPAKLAQQIVKDWKLLQMNPSLIKKIGD